MLMFFACLLFADPAAAPPTTEEYCQTAYENRLHAFREIDIQVDRIKRENDWDKLSESARQKLLKPYDIQRAALTADKSLRDVVKYPRQAKPGEVFHLRASYGKKKPRVYTIVRGIDETTVFAEQPTEVALYPMQPAVLVDYPVVVEGLKPTEAKGKPGSVLKLDGTWCRIDDLKLNGHPCVRITRWPHETEAKKLWPKFLAEKEPKADKPKK